MEQSRTKIRSSSNQSLLEQQCDFFSSPALKDATKDEKIKKHSAVALKVLYFGKMVPTTLVQEAPFTHMVIDFVTESINQS